MINEDSKYCILPSGSDPRRITKEDYTYAQSIIDKYNKQQKQNNNLNNNLNNNQIKK